MEDRSRLELEPAVLRTPDFGAGEVRRQQVGCELDAGEIGIQARGQGADRGRLRQPGSAFDEQMAIGQQRDQQSLDQRRLTYDFSGKALAQGCKSAVQTGDVGVRVGRVGETVHAGPGKGSSRF